MRGFVSHALISFWITANNKEARAGIEPAHNGFADRRVTTSPSGHTVRIAEMIVSSKDGFTCRGGGIGRRTGLKTRRRPKNLHVGSIPTLGTRHKTCKRRDIYA